MKKNRILGLFSAALLLLGGACTSDTLDPGKNQGSLKPGDDTPGGVYLSVDFQMPTGASTRSQTITGGGSTDGTEVGSEAENYVSSALIVLAASEAKPENQIEKYGFIVAGEVPSSRISTYTVPNTNANAQDNNGKQYRATAKLQKENLNSLYGAYGDGSVPEVYVFVFANPTTDLLNLFDGANTTFGTAKWINETCEVIQTTNASQSKNIGIWGTNSFLMNNVDLALRELPKNLLDWEHFSSIDSPFHLSSDNNGNGYEQVNNSTANNRGNIKVERSVARFDFKDGSPKDNTYTVLMNTNAEGDFDKAQPVVDVQIQKMCLVNMCNKFYYLPRVSANGMDVDYTLCGREEPWIRNPSTGVYTGGNYVVGPYADIFGGSAVMTSFDDYMNFPFFENNGSFNNEAMSSTRWDVVKVSDVLNGTPDQYVKPGETTPSGDFRVWRYVTENVIPLNTDKQMKGVSTGVVFKGKLLGNENAAKDNSGYYEEDWNKGNIQNLANCLNGKQFTYNGEKMTLNGKSNHDPILYYYNGHLYLGWRHMRQAAIQASCTVNANGKVEINISNSLYKAVFGEGPIPHTYTFVSNTGVKEEHDMVYIDSDGNQIKIDDPMWTKALENTSGEEYQAYLKSPNYIWGLWALNGKEVGDDATGSNSSKELNDMRDAITGAGIYIYQSSEDDAYGPGYYCYYYYWNRHADNGLPGSMGPMEFCVVRNNVYKLYINSIARLGHPRIPENDPDNPKPDDPDESDEIYLDVRMEIVPWVVRMNKIDF